jgi:peptidase A4-like protein
MAKRKTSDQETLKHITTYAAPPRGFDFDRAAARTLYKHGIPRRPDAIKEPHLKAIWDRAMASKPTFIKAEVEVDHLLSRRKRPVISRPAIAAVGQRAKSKKFSPSGWAGVVTPVNFSPPEPAVSVYGEWFIPTITSIPNEPQAGQTVGFWVGIDGFGNNQVLQAGSAATISGQNVDYWVWTEWYPLGAIRVSNFPIKPGDYLTVLVCANQPNHGFCSMLNKTTNQAISIGITPPGNLTSIGATAEWIVEGISSILPVFSPVVFTNCSAGTKNHAFNMHGGIVTEITGAGGANLTTAGITSDTQGLVKWLNAS